MYSVSESYKKAIASNIRGDQALKGEITLASEKDTEATEEGGATEEKKIQIDGSNIVQGTVSYKAQCTSGSGISVGDVTAAELDFGLITDLGNPYSLDGARVTLSYGLVTDSDGTGVDTWEWVPLGTFYVTDIERKPGYVQLTALDGFIRMDVPLGSCITTGVPGDILQSCCSNAGLTASLSNISQFPNHTMRVSLPDRSEVETLRDCAMWICQLLSCAGRINREGMFELVPLHSASVRTISADERTGTTTVSDSVQKITKATMTVDNVDYTAGDGGQTLELQENPFLSGMDAASVQDALDAILAEITKVEYTPMSCSLFGDPSLMPGDYVKLTDTASLVERPMSLITSMTWSFRGTHSLVSDGSSDMLRTSYSQSNKAVSALKAAAEAARKLAVAANDSTELLKNVVGGNVLIRQTAGETNEILIMDSIDPEKAVKIWRWNMGGLGYSDNCTGADNPERQYTVAITMDGAVSADFVKTGLLTSLNGVSWINMDTGAFSFAGGALYYDGISETLTIGAPGSEIQTVYTNDRISFQRNGEEVAYISGADNKLYIRYVNAIESLSIGKFIFQPRTNGNLSLVKED